MKKILLITDAGVGKKGWYHVGDEAVFWSLYQRIISDTPDAQITIFARSNVNKKITGAITIDSAPFFDNKTNFVFSKIVPFFKIRPLRFIILLLFPQYKNMFLKIKSTDYIVVSGGGNLNSHFRDFIFNRFIIVLFAQILNKKIYFAPQTIGPLFYKKDFYYIKYIAKNATFLQVRDDSSLDMVKLFNCLTTIGC